MTGWEVGAGVGLDLLVGDPRWLPHPVRGIGWMIHKAEGAWRFTGLPLRAAGVLLCVSVVLVTCAVVYATLPWANVYWVFSFLALRSLDAEAGAVIRCLQVGDLAAARQQAGMIVGRDTGELDEAEIVRAVLETVSENLSDGVIAPLFYLALLGPVGMAVYKAVNTLDSMTGYKNEKYRELGWASARLDDVLNYVPARLSAALVWVSALLLGMPALRSIRLTLRDAGSQPSPNSGWPEAAFAGALGVQLGGVSFYGGAPSRKAYLGDVGRPLKADVFPSARRLLYLPALLMAGLVALWM